HGLFSEGPADVEAVAIELRDVGRRPTEQREQRNRFAVLLDRDRQGCEARARCFGGDLERALLADELLGFVDREARRFAAACARGYGWQAILRSRSQAKDVHRELRLGVSEIRASGRYTGVQSCPTKHELCTATLRFSAALRSSSGRECLSNRCTTISKPGIRSTSFSKVFRRSLASKQLRLLNSRAR